MLSPDQRDFLCSCDHPRKRALHVSGWVAVINAGCLSIEGQCSNHGGWGVRTYAIEITVFRRLSTVLEAGPKLVILEFPAALKRWGQSYRDYWQFL
jgi:hypothetical protein